MSVLASAMSKKQRLAILKKERRKRKRQALAQARDGDGENHMSDEEEDDGGEEEYASQGETSGLESQRQHAEWLERERLAQEAFRLRSEREETARKRQEDEERRIKEEWDLQQKKEEEEKEHKQQEKKNREEAVQKMLDQAESQLSKPGPWMNPEAPKAENSENYGTERDVQNCPFFLKTGACRFGDRCSRRHAYPTSSSTLMIRSMFVTFGMDQCHRDDYDTDASLEHSEEDLHEHFVEFYQDVLPEFQSLGRVVQFKVSCNFEPHLRGNVYVQFSTEEQCMEAYQKFNGRWYAGKQLHCELCPVTRWKNAICGLFNKQKCPKGKHCNFLHVFRNPRDEFWEADRDMSPDRSRDGSRRGGWLSERRGDRSWRHRQGSRSPTRSERSGTGRRGSERRRSHSRERAHSHRRVESMRSEGQSSRWRQSCSSSSSSRRERCRSRSRSGDRERDGLRNRSRERERDSRRSRERDRSPDGSQNGDTRKGRSRSGSKEWERRRPKRERSENRSPDRLQHKDEEGRDGSSDEGKSVRSHRKHSKKSKKKSKKKHKKKKKSCSAEVISSSGESENQDDPDTEIKEEVSPPNNGDDAQDVLYRESRSNPCLETQFPAEVKSTLEETREGTQSELPCHKEEYEDSIDIKPHI